MGLKVTMFFDEAKFGWSESHYWIAGGAVDSIDAQCLALGKARAALLGGGGALNGQPGPTLNFIRVSDDTVFRDSHLVQLNSRVSGPLGLTSSTAVQKGPTGQPNVAVRMRGESTPRVRAYFYLAGCPAAINPWGNYVDFSQITGYPTYVDKYISVLQTGWGFRAKSLPVQSKVYMVGSEAVQPGRLQIYVVGAYAANIGDPIQLSGFRMASRANQPINGKYQIGNVVANAGPPATTIITLNNTSGRDPTAVVKMGTVNSLTYAPVPYTDVFAVAVSTRKRGVGFGRPVGRRAPAKVYLA